MEEARQNDLWDTVAYCAENHKMVWLKYETVESGEIISRRVAPYSYRTRDTKVRGRSTYFYAEDFTPGEEQGIKCFLIENCLDAKESNRKFTPRHPIEIKQEIDKLEQKRKDDELKKNKEAPVGTNDEPKGDNDEIVDEPKEKPKAKPKPEPKPTPKPEQKPAPQKSEPKPEPKKEEKPKPTPQDKEKEQQKKDDGKVKVEPVSKTEPKKEEPPPADNKPKPEEKPDVDNSVTLDDKGNPQEDGEVQVTDGDGNTVK